MDQDTDGAATAGAALDAATELKRFVKDFRSFQDRIETRLNTQDERIALVDRKAAAPARRALSATGETPPHRKALTAYLRSGDESGLRAATLDSKSLVTTDDAHGGFLLEADSGEHIATVRRACGSLRAVANVVTVEGGVYEALVDHADVQTSWVDETSAPAETEASSLSRVTIPLHELAAMPKASQRLLEDSAFDVERWLADSVAAQFARAESAAFVHGDGVSMPKGFLTYPLVDASAPVWGAISAVPTGAVGNFNATDPANDLVDLIYSLGARYRANASFVMNSKTAGVVRKLKDVDGRFLWGEGLSVGEPTRLCGFSVAICEDMPDIGVDAPAIAFGDFRAAYTIAERPALRVLRDPFSAKPHVQFYVSSRVGGDVVDFEAIRVLKFGVA